MRVRIIQPAKSELSEAIDYYNNERPGLGVEFAHEVRLTIKRIVSHPFAWAKIDVNLRRCPTNRFPFSIIYYIKDNSIIVIAVMHQKRRPKYWRDRL